MDLKIKDVAELLNVSETTIRRWLADGKIPAYRINQQFRFSRHEIEDWVLNHRIEKNEDSPFGQHQEETQQEKKDASPTTGSNKQFSLYRALHKGWLIPNMPGNTKEEIISSTVKTIAKDMNLDAEVLTELLLDRENLQPTALNHGVAIPHTRDFLLSAHHDIITLVFPEKPLPYGAFDGQPVHSLFFLFACNDKRHLHLLAKIAHFSSQPEALRMLQSRPSKEKLLEYVKQWEGSIPQIH